MRTRYRFVDGQLVEFKEAPASRGLFVMGDIQPFVSPIDRTEISSRSQLREHERKHGVRQCGNDWTGSVKPSWWD